jgi:hypothetical protein
MVFFGFTVALRGEMKAASRLSRGRTKLFSTGGVSGR